MSWGPMSNPNPHIMRKSSHLFDYESPGIALVSQEEVQMEHETEIANEKRKGNAYYWRFFCLCPLGRVSNKDFMVPKQAQTAVFEPK